MSRHGDRAATKRPLPPGFFTIWTTVALDLVGFGIVAPLQGLYVERLGASPTTVGFLFASFSLAQFVFAPVWGRISDRIGRKPVIIVSLFGTAIGSFLTGASNVLWLVFLGRIIDGASGGSVSVAQAAVTDVASDEDRPHLLGLLSAAFGVGFVLGPAIGGLAALGGPRVPFFVAGSIALVNAVAAIKRLPETSTAAQRAADAHAPRVREGRRRQLLRLATIGFIATSAFSIFEATFALFAEHRFSLGSAGVATVFVGIGLGLVAVQGGAIRPVTNAIGAVGALRAGLMLNVAGLLMLAASKHWVVLVPALVLLVAGQGLAAPSLTASVAQVSDPSRRGQALGFQQGVGAIARVVGPAMGGALFQHAGVPVPYVVGAGMVFAAAALAFAFVA